MKVAALKILTTAFVLAFVTATASCSVEGVPSVNFLDHMADVIVVGSATPVAVSPGSSQLSIEVVRVIKGRKLLAANNIVVDITSASAECKVSATSQPVTAIWFLKALPSGGLALADSPRSQSCHPFQTEYEASSGPLPSKWTYPDGASAKDKLAYELAASIESHDGNGPYALVLNPQLLRGVSKESGGDIYRKLELDGTSSLQLIGILGLARQGDIPAIQNLASNITALEQMKARQFYVRNNVQIPITYSDINSTAQTRDAEIAKSVALITSQSVAAVSSLGKILQTTSSKLIRYASARALQNIHTALALSFLAPLLDDADSQLRAYAIGGLSCFANAVPVIDSSIPGNGLTLGGTGSYKTTDTLSHFAMGVETIAQRPDYFLNFWRSWWATNSASVGVQASKS